VYLISLFFIRRSSFIICFNVQFPVSHNPIAPTPVQHQIAKSDRAPRSSRVAVRSRNCPVKQLPQTIASPKSGGRALVDMVSAHAGQISRNFLQIEWLHPRRLPGFRVHLCLHRIHRSPHFPVNFCCFSLALSFSNPLKTTLDLYLIR
jgi:hypothetical protein